MVKDGEFLVEQVLTLLRSLAFIESPTTCINTISIEKLMFFQYN